MAHVLRRLLATWGDDETGEGVISAAIVVLIMALLGAAMWAAFNGIFVDATADIQGTVDSIGG
ncbi:MAG TPA: hypothetical protein VK906_17760 [Egicoccus sp.]|nr:hypothetical protein [Egicoccus sp.]HSK25036.1 hypothetical protein [Egicoccus sp.]